MGDFKNEEMKFKYLAFIILGFTLACNSSKQTVEEQSDGTSASDVQDANNAGPEIYANTITENELKAHLFTYASDEFEGRETGEPGQKKAAEYIKAVYDSLEVPGALAGGEYYQKVPLEMVKLPEGSITANGKEFLVGNDFLSFNSIEGSFDSVIFAGYGIETDNYSDFTDLNVEGKIILVKAGEPKNEDGTYVISGNNDPSPWSDMSDAVGKRTEVAMAKGVRAVLYYDPENYARYRGYYSYMKSNNSGRMTVKANDNIPGLIVVDDELAKVIYPEIEAGFAPTTLNIPVNLELTSSNAEIDTENVVAVIEGSTKPNEYIVISSHLDHIGITSDGRINNGADDDGSGTVAMLEIAEAMQQAKNDGNGPGRSVVFLHVTGEEKGLLGSQYYTDYAPVFPLAQTVANLNIDMIGRIDPKRDGDSNYIYLIGSDKLSTELHELSEEVNEKYTNITLDYTYNDLNDPNRFYYRSDHYNFAKNNVPIIFYFNGTHADYHRPTDTPDKINYDLLAKRAKLIFYTAWEIANRDERLLVDKLAK